jgi:YggT family protein
VKKRGQKCLPPERERPFTARHQGCQGRARPARRLFAHGKPATCAHRFPQPNPAMRALLDVILIALNIYMWIVIAAVILSWLVAFNVVNTRHPFVASVADFLYRITEPALRPIRNLLPNLGGIDISPIILFLIIILIERVIIYYIYPNVI